LGLAVQVLQQETVAIDLLEQVGQILHFQPLLQLVVVVAHLGEHQVYFQLILEVQAVAEQHLMVHNLLEVLEPLIKVLQGVMVALQVELNIMLLEVAVQVQLALLQQIQAMREMVVLV
jgi:hypothetical protein